MITCIDEAYENYLKGGDIKWLKQEEVDTPIGKMNIPIPYTKGTPASYQFLFRILYNSDFDVFYTKDAVLKASDGAWYVAKSLKLATGNKNFLKVNNYRLFGETTKTIATIENATSTGNIIEVFISDITRLFQSGEFVRVVDTNNQDVLFGGQPLRAKIVGP